MNIKNWMSLPKEDESGNKKGSTLHHDRTILTWESQVAPSQTWKTAGHYAFIGETVSQT